MTFQKKEVKTMKPNLLILQVRPARIELATFGFVVQHSIQLSYGRIMVSFITIFRTLL